MSTVPATVDDIVSLWLELIDRDIQAEPEVLCHALRVPDMVESVTHAIEDVALFETRFSEDSSPKGPFLSNSRLGKTQIVDEGGYGIVAKAWDDKLQRMVAIKILRQDAQEPWIQERFEHEVVITSQMDHPGVVPVFDKVLDRRNRVCLVMRYVEGCTLQDAIDYVYRGRLPIVEIDGKELDERAWAQQGFPITKRQLIDRFISVCNTVAYAHESRKVIHRDLKPNNIRLGPYGETVVLDWGAAKRLGEQSSDPAWPRTTTSEEDDGKTVALQSAWTAPEVREDPRCADERSDIYGLGATLYSILTGTTPSHQLDESSISDSPKQLNAIVQMAMDQASGSRYASVHRLCNDILAWRDHRASVAHQEGVFERVARLSRRHKILFRSVSAILFVVLLATVNSTVQTYRRDIQTTKLAVELMSMTDPVEFLREKRTLLFQEFRDVGVRLDRDFSARSTPGESVFDRLRLSLNLTALGVDQSEFVLEQVINGDHDDLAPLNQPTSVVLREAETVVIPRLRDAYNESSNQSTRFRIAAMLLILGAPQEADEILDGAPDPTTRLEFMEYMSDWPVDFAGVEKHINAWDADTQYAMSIVFGKLSSSPLSDAAQASISTALSKCSQSPSAGKVYSAAAWAMKRWSLDVPELSPDVASVSINLIGIPMIEIPAGRFRRKDLLYGDSPEQMVELSNDFYMSSIEVTARAYELALADSKYAEQPDDIRRKPGDWKSHLSVQKSPDPDCPVQSVTWFDCISFCNWLSEKEGRKPCYRFTGKTRKFPYDDPSSFEEKSVIIDLEIVTCDFDADGYRLPTEAEWEHAIRAETETAFFTGPKATGPHKRFLEEYAHFASERCEIVAMRPPNPYGLFNLAGNVREWTWDWEQGYEAEAVENPTGGKEQGAMRKIIRGGDWMLASYFCQSWVRTGYNALIFRDYHNGFRIVTNSAKPIGNAE